MKIKLGLSDRNENICIIYVIINFSYLQLNETINEKKTFVFFIYFHPLEMEKYIIKTEKITGKINSSNWIKKTEAIIFHVQN